MIRAIVKNGILQPVAPLPCKWQDGQEILLSVVDDGQALTPDELDTWESEMNELASQADPQDGERLRVAIADAHEREKAALRCQA